MVAEQRKKKGLSQNQLAKLCGVPQSVISDIESGKTKSPRLVTMLAIAKALDINLDKLVNARS